MTMGHLEEGQEAELLRQQHEQRAALATFAARRAADPMDVFLRIVRRIVLDNPVHRCGRAREPRHARGLGSGVLVEFGVARVWQRIRIRGGIKGKGRSRVGFKLGFVVGSLGYCCCQKHRQ